MDVVAVSDAPKARAGFVALVGRPNVGKSTLLNHVLGEKIAIVSAKAQTTRQRLKGVLTRPEGQIVFVDTPGIHKPHHLLGEQLVEHARRALTEVDLVWMLVDGTVAPGKGDRYVAEMVQAAKRPVMLVINKLDMVGKAERTKHVADYEALGQWARTFVVSAKHGEGIDELVAATMAALPEGHPFYPEDELTDQPMRAIAAELVREQIFRQTGEEVPHSTAVLVEEYKYREAQGMTYILARIIVERSSQKAIVIGKGAAKLRSIGAEARAAIERMAGTPVYLDLKVEVIPNWRDQKHHLRELGYLVD
jgi:GTP-binding protein Era